MIEQTRFLSTIFLRSEFKLTNIYSGVNFCGENFCGSFYLRELIFESLEKPQKSQELEPAKMLCRKVARTLFKNAAKSHRRLGLRMAIS